MQCETEDEVMDKIIQGKEKDRMETVRQSNTWYQPSTLTWIRVSQELNNDQGNHRHKNTDKEMVESETENDKLQNPELPLMECDNMQLGTSQDQTKDKNFDEETLEYTNILVY